MTQYWVQIDFSADVPSTTTTGSPIEFQGAPLTAQMVTGGTSALYLIFLLPNFSPPNNYIEQFYVDLPASDQHGYIDTEVPAFEVGANSPTEFELHQSIGSYFVVGSQAAPTVLVGPQEYVDNSPATNAIDRLEYPQWEWVLVNVSAPTLFYVKDINGNLVAARYLTYNGTSIIDPNTTNAQNTHIYDVNGNLFPTQNVNGYEIVPADYSVQNAISFAKLVASEMSITDEGELGEVITGLPAALGTMAGAFARGGSQELQRTYDGISNGTFVSAFTDAASFNLGLVSGYAGIPLSWTEFGGGKYNEATAIYDILFTDTSPPNTSGAYGLSTINTASIEAGYAFGQSLAGDPQADPTEVAVIGGTGDYFTSAVITTSSAGNPLIDINLKSGGSQQWQLIPTAGVADEEFTYSGPNETGTLTTVEIDYSNGTSLITQIPAGNTAVIAGNGSTVNAGNGNDTIIAGDNSTIKAGNGIDTVIAGSNDKISLGNGNDTVLGGSGDTIQAGNGTDTVSTGANSSVTAGNSPDTVTVGDNSKVVLGNGQDQVTAGASSTITVGNGSDTINVGKGDTVTVGNGQDSFILAQTAAGNIGAVTINHFNPAKDGITFSSQLTTAVSYLDNAQGNAVITLDTSGDTITLVGVQASALHASNFHFV